MDSLLSTDNLVTQYDHDIKKIDMQFELSLNQLSINSTQYDVVFHVFGCCVFLSKKIETHHIMQLISRLTAAKNILISIVKYYIH